MLNLAGYQETLPIYAGTRTLVYRAIQTNTQQSVIIKVLRNPHPNFQELLQLRNQYMLTRHLEHPAFVQSLTLERYRNGYALVMLDEGAISLWDYWQPFGGDLKEFLSIAIQMAQALHYLGQQRIIHKDIKPANILMCPETRQIKFIDFSISSLLPKEQQQLLNPKVLEGTLAYISPEQTGRMNRGIDYRTDFYSLGVTLYELLTGVLPFQSNDPVELLHCHIAKEPLAPNELLDTQGNPYPEAISQIIIKLMAKNAEERYQSALGLKHDLERCWQQLQATGEITPFELGEHDVCDRFLIPEKLYGREAEVQMLLEAFKRVSQGDEENHCNSEFLLVAGFSGIGKTAVINEVHKPIVKQRGYFIKGKFDQLNRNIPFWALVQAFRDLIGQLLSESDTDLATWKAKILKAVGENGQVIIDVIPQLKRIIGPQPPVPELSSSAVQNRFNLMFGKFVRVFARKEHPLVIFLDDLQWADPASLNLLKLLMDKSEAGYLLVLGAYRDNEVFPAHPLMLTLDEIQKQGAKINTLTLAPLDKVDINRLVADTLLCSVEIAAPLSQLVYQKTQGNPFFTTQFLQGLYEDGWIKFDLAKGGWQCNLTQVRQLALTDDVVEFMVGRLQKLPKATQEVLKLAACIGNRFDLATLAVVCESSQEEVASDLWRALQEGFIIPESETYKFFQGYEHEEKVVKEVSVSYRFLHDRVQQAAYALLPQENRASVHLSIGNLLLSNFSLEQRYQRLFEVVNHLNYGINLISNPTEKQNLLHLNVLASHQAHASTAYAPALEYLLTALNLLGEDSWEQDYEVAKVIYTDAANNAYLSGDLCQMDTLLGTALAQINTLLEQVPLYEIKIQALVSQHQLQDALKVGLDILHQLEIDFPEQPTPEDFGKGLQDVNQGLAGRPVADLILLPEMEDPVALAAMKILLRLSAVVVIAAPHLMPFAFCTMVGLSIEKGNTTVSALGYATYGMILCSAVGDIDTGYQFGKLAVQVLDKFSGKAVQAKTMTRLNAGVWHWKESLHSTLPSMLETYQVALETGDLEYAAISAQVYAYHLYFSGQELTQVEQELAAYSQAITQIQHKAFLYCIKAYRQHALNLLGKAADPLQLIGEAYDETIDLPHQNQANDFYGMGVVHLFKGIGCYLLGAYDNALENLEQTAVFLRSLLPFAVGCALNFYDSLTRLGIISQYSAANQAQMLEQIAANQEKLRHWANHGPMNYSHRFHLVEAQQHYILGNNYQAMEFYDLAIAEAQGNRYIQEEALANELAAKFYLDWGKEKIAATYMQEAYYCYARWGAKAKTDQLEETYPQLLSGILQKQQIEFNVLDTLESLTQTLTKSSSTTLSDTLDLASILQAAQTLSRNIELNQLLADICRIILTNSGAQKAALLIPQANQWQLRAMTQMTTDGTLETNTRAQLLTAEDLIPIRLIQYVKNTLETVLINEGKTEVSGISEGYLLKHQPQSVLCVPLLNQGQLVAILYQEHLMVKGVFTRDRLTIVQFFCAQAAIALHNAQLYDQAQQALKDLTFNRKKSHTYDVREVLG